MQNAEFIYWLFNKDKKALYVDDLNRVQIADDNNLKPNGLPAHLQHAPDGWRDSLVKYSRNIKYLGLFRDFTVPMNFKKDGAVIVKNAMATFGMEAILYLGIGKLNRTSYPAKYEPWYVGELDFSKWDQKNDSVPVMVTEGGLSKYFKAHEATIYEIPIDADPQAELVVMDGIPFSNSVQWTIFDNSIYYQTNSKFYNVGMGTIAQEGSTQGVLASDQFAEAFNQQAPFLTDDNKYIAAIVQGDIAVNVIIDRNIELFIRQRNLNTGVDTDYTIVNGSLGLGGHDYSFFFNINVTPNDVLIFCVKTASGVVEPYFKILGGNMFLNYDVTFQQTIIKGLKPLRLLQQLVSKMTNGMFTAKSDYLASMDDIVITSGSAIRNHEGQSFTVNGSVIKTSVDEFFQWAKTRQKGNKRGAGLGIENDVLVIEDLKYFFRNDTIIHLGEISKPELKVADDLEINTIKAGYANQTYDNVNGLDEFNVTQNYTTPHTRIVKEMDLTSPYRADCYGIELMRVNLDGKDTTDNRSDNDTFFLNVKKGGAYVYYSGGVTFNGGTIRIPAAFLNSMNGNVITISGTLNVGTYTVTNTSYIIVGYTTLTVAEAVTDGIDNVVITGTSAIYNMINRPAYSSITGVLHPTKVFNTDLTPHHMVLNTGDLLHSLLDKQDMNFITFQSGEKNSELSTTLDGVTVTEKANIQIADLPAKLFNPYYMFLTVPTDFNFLANVRQSPYSKISYLINGKMKFGYLFDGGVKQATRDVQQLQLLCAPETTLEQLIGEI